MTFLGEIIGILIVGGLGLVVVHVTGMADPAAGFFEIGVAGAGLLIGGFIGMMFE